MVGQYALSSHRLCLVSAAIAALCQGFQLAPDELFAQRLDAVSERLAHKLTGETRIAASKLTELERSLENLSPHALARRGYGLVLKGGRPVCAARTLKNEEKIVVQFPDGDVLGTVDEVALRA